MIVYTVFTGDNNEILKEVQHDAYWKNVGIIFRACKSALIHADSMLNTNLLIVEKLQQLDGFDHRNLQDAHDIFAAAYRHEIRLNDKASELPEDERKAVYLSNWNAWYAKQVDLVILVLPQFVRSVVESVVFPNSIMRQLSEEAACRVLVNFYGLRSWEGKVSYAKSYANLRE